METRWFCYDFRDYKFYSNELKTKKSVMNKKLIIIFRTCIGSLQLIGQDNINYQDDPTIDKITKTIEETIENTYLKRIVLKTK